jgi:HSP20 family protein
MNVITRNALSSYEPFLGRLDELLFRPAAAWENRVDSLPIRFDVRESPEAYTVHAELPGVKKDDIHVQIERNEVTISAEARREGEQKDGDKWLRTERFVGKTGRRFALPVELDESKAAAKFVDGVLELTLPKKAPVAGRKLEIN